MTYKKISDWTPVARLLASLTVSVLIIGFGAFQAHIAQVKLANPKV